MSARGSGVVQTELAPGRPGPLPGSPPDVEPRPRRSARKRKEIATAYTMLIPSLIGVGFFLVVPIALVIAISFVNWNLISAPTFVGLDNYEAMFVSPGFWNSVKVTIIFSLIAIPAAIMIGLLIAVGLNRKLPGSGILQILYVIPWVAAPLSLGIVWSWLLAPSGLINELLGTRVSWLASESTALPVVAFVYVWQNVGYISLFFLAALQSIPRDIYEAASLDGAGAVRTLWSITLPLVRPTTFFVTVTSFIASFQIFDLVYGLTDGNPGYPGGTTDVIAARIYTAAFASPRIGEAAAMAVFLMVLIVAVTVIQQRYFAKRMTYEMS
ncbi:sugar ABC transporter permease [Trueperella pyogenes]|uniref:Sugar ABC transporter permease n=1 Tax=Trueperella pyogenes TaxID=1661 RepID=A0A3Q9GG46_9ACTO|nr:sugar ABC transporter permease [Trueperella pyogenes]AZR07111.1 sugar ABC transporter permease [Trueperella pyogenes]MCI7689680.1 sugar ABC transporter permease [Trueperella pyogenes]QIU87326.1 sugar ABC transporter permease [Trueperella pyogenes]